MTVTLASSLAGSKAQPTREQAEADTLLVERQQA